MKKMLLLLVVGLLGTTIFSCPAQAAKDPPGEDKPWMCCPNRPAASDEIGWADPHNPPEAHPYQLRSQSVTAVPLDWDAVFLCVSLNKHCSNAGFVRDGKRAKSSSGSGRVLSSER